VVSVTDKEDKFRIRGGRPDLPLWKAGREDAIFWYHYKGIVTNSSSVFLELHKSC